MKIKAETKSGVVKVFEHDDVQLLSALLRLTNNNAKKAMMYLDDLGGGELLDFGNLVFYSIEQHNSPEFSFDD